MQREEVDWVEAFGKKIRSMTWMGDNDVLLKLESGVQLRFYVKDNRLQVEAYGGESLTKQE